MYLSRGYYQLGVEKQLRFLSSYSILHYKLLETPCTTLYVLNQGEFLLWL